VPDFDIVLAWTCASNLSWETKVTGSKGDAYTVWWGRLPEAKAMDVGATNGWQCECKAYKYRGHCKHIDSVKSQRCGWNAFLEPTCEPEKDQDGKPICPECGGPVRPMKVAV